MKDIINKEVADVLSRKKEIVKQNRRDQGSSDGADSKGRQKNMRASIEQLGASKPDSFFEEKVKQFEDQFA